MSRSDEVLSNEEFTQFLDYYKGKDKCFDTLTNISWPKNERTGENLPEAEPLIKNDELKMWSLDDMTKEGIGVVFDGNNLPTTTDALFCKPEDDGKLTLYFIEFKWFNSTKERDKKIFENTLLKYDIDSDKKINRKDLVNDLEDLKEAHKDINIQYSLRLKPFESIFIVIPDLYKKYCVEQGIQYKNIYEFYRRCNIKVYSVLKNYSSSDFKEEYDINKNIKPKNFKIEVPSSKKGRKKGKRNRSKERKKYNSLIGPKSNIGNVIHKQYKRLEHNSFIKFADLFPKDHFNRFLEDEGLPLSNS